MKYFKKLSEFAPGIPSKNNKEDFSKVETPKGNWEAAIQRHDAQKAGRHFDLRLVNPTTNKAYSWALRYLPNPGQKRLAIRQPDHTPDYLNFEGTIPEGYGAGEVKLETRGKANISKINKDKISFDLDDTPYALIRMQGDKWLLVGKKS